MSFSKKKRDTNINIVCFVLSDRSQSKNVVRIVQNVFVVRKTIYTRVVGWLSESYLHNYIIEVNVN